MSHFVTAIAPLGLCTKLVVTARLDATDRKVAALAADVTSDR